MGSDKEKPQNPRGPGWLKEWAVEDQELLFNSLRQMSETIVSWFDPSQEWHPTTRGEQVEIANSQRTPNLYTIKFYYDAAHPPIAKDSFCRSCDSPYPGNLDLLKVFSPRMISDDQVFFWGDDNAGIRGVENVGPVDKDFLSGILVSVDQSDPRREIGKKPPMRLVVRIGVNTNADKLDRVFGFLLPNEQRFIGREMAESESPLL